MSFNTSVSTTADAVNTAITFGSVTDIARQNAAVADIGDDADLLGEVQARIAECNVSGGLSQESLAFAMMVIQHTSDRLGVNNALLQFPSVESYGEEGRAVVDDRTLQLATEGLAATAADLVRRQYSTLLRSWRFLGTQITAQRSSLKRLIDSADKLKGKQDTDEITVDFNRLHQDGKVPSDPASFLSGYYSEFGKIQKKWLTGAGPAWNANFQLVGKLKRDNSKDFESSLKEIADRFVDVRQKLGVNAQLVVPGGFRFFKDRKLSYNGSNAAARRLDELANKNYPRRMGDMQRIGEVGEVKVKPLTAQQVSTLCKSALNAMEPMTAFDAFYESLSAQATSILNGPMWLVPFLKPIVLGVTVGHGGVKALVHGLTRTRATMGWGPGIRQDYRAELRALRDALRTANHLIWHVPYDTMSVTTGINRGLIAYCRASLKTYK